MLDWLQPYLSYLAEQPVLQGVVAGLATFVLEDPTTIGCGLLVAEEKMAFLTALIGVWLGIAVGDIGLYGMGRFGGAQLARRGHLRSNRARRASQWLERNLVLAVVVSRFVPGMRLPTYVGAGILRTSLSRFIAVAVAASLVWTLLLLWLTVLAGEYIMPMLGAMRWPVAGLALLALVLLQRQAVRAVEHGSEGGEDGERVVSFYEFWPPVVFYVPVALHWLWLALRFRGLLLPTVANPTVFSGGLIGESKRQIMDLVGEEQRRWVARYIVLDVHADRELALASIRREMDAAQLDFPVVAKPDVGQRGAGVWPIFRENDLVEYLERFPANCPLMLQELVGYDGRAKTDNRAPDFKEAGVMYWRHPGAELGSIPSITLKLFPVLVGDGEHTVEELIERDARARYLAGVYRDRLKAELDHVPAIGESVPLVFAGNHCQGVINKDGTAMLTTALYERIDAIAHSMPGFYFGRFDIRFDSLEKLLDGESFKIVEINGAAGEATHIWDASVSLTDAYRDLRKQIRTLFMIAVENRKRGHRPMKLLRFVRAFISYHRLARTYPKAR
ncbi:MAG: hypothetical protein GY906_16900 [bacterium]|nr:hypothetical protein [bacterium]